MLLRGGRFTVLRRDLALVAAGLFAVGCAKEEHFTSPLGLAELSVKLDRCVGDQMVLEAARATAPTPSPTQNGFIDTILVDLLAFDMLTGAVHDGGEDAGARGSPAAPSCRACMTGEAACTRVARRCLCAQRLEDWSAVERELAGLRFEGVRDDTALCVRLIGFRRAAGPESSCDERVCAPDWSGGDEPPLCVLSDVGVASPSQTPIVLHQLFCAPGFSGAAATQISVLRDEIRNSQRRCSALQRYCGALTPVVCAVFWQDCAPELGVDLGFGVGTRECAAF